MDLFEMKMDSISRLTQVNIDLNKITSREVADHFPRFSDVLERIIEQVLEQINPDANTTKVDIMGPEELACEAMQYDDGDVDGYQGQLSISITETFPCK
jgi:hypothetical protein